MRAYRALLLLLLAPLCMGADNAGCQSQASSDVNQDRIYTSYWLLYDVESDKTFARAQFRFGSEIGTTLELVDGATVEYDGEPMPFNALLDWHEAVLAGPVEQGVFRYADVNGREVEFEMPAIAKAEVSADFPAVLDSNSAFEVTWEGEPLQVDERMEVIVASAANRFNFIYVEQRTPGTSGVVIGANELVKITPGAALIQVRRHRDYPLPDETSAGGKLTTTYQSEEVVFEMQ